VPGRGVVPWLALALVLTAASTLGQSSPVWGHGGLAAVCALSAVVIAGVLSSGRLAALLALGPLTALGR
jgi:peptidoglycan/LPS O-acetylase OafA/YrhL